MSVAVQAYHEPQLHTPLKRVLAKTLVQRMHCGPLKHPQDSSADHERRVVLPDGNTRDPNSTADWQER
jgi:hypothetical protein